jgi:hypothetical protein
MEGDSIRHGAVILDLSLGGMRVEAPREFVSKVYENGEESRFEASFVMPPENEPVRVVCTPVRVVPLKGNPHLGVRFADAGFSNYQRLQQYLV